MSTFKDHSNDSMSSCTVSIKLLVTFLLVIFSWPYKRSRFCYSVASVCCL